MISVLVFTLNEENNLPRCLDCVKWSDDVHVLDSYSTDRTVEIARQCGATVSFRKFDTYAQHQNWAFSNVPFKHAWVLYLDADERVTTELAECMRAAVANPGPNVAFKIQRRDFFLDTWLKHVQMMAFYERLFRPEKMRYERLVHCVSKPDGPVAVISGYLDHYPFSKGIADWVARHNRYSTLEAQQIMIDRAQQKPLSIRAIFFPRHASERRQNLKELYYHLPMRPLAKFFLMYILKRGFLDKAAGLTYCTLIGFYEFMIVLKVRELEREAARANASSR
jgi:glycosyltransferase involved in cell wall biosynthesis